MQRQFAAIQHIDDDSRYDFAIVTQHCCRLQTSAADGRGVAAD